jgi:hypothetical protein
MKENILYRIITLETDLESLGNLQVFFLNESRTMKLLLSDLNYHKKLVETVYTWSSYSYILELNRINKDN